MILIIGDSWGVGEWQPFTKEPENYHDRIPEISHGGLAEYIRATGEEVINLSVAAGSHTEIIRVLKSFLLSNPALLKNVTKIIAFQTSWTRDLITNFDINILKQGYSQTKNIYISKYYNDLTAVSKFFKIPIVLIGGLGDTLNVHNFNVHYPGVTIGCQSLVNLLLTQNSNIETPICSIFSGEIEMMLKIIKEHNSVNDTKVMLDDIAQFENRISQLYNNPQWFWPDGVHPNRQASLVLFNHLRSHNFIG